MAEAAQQPDSSKTLVAFVVGLLIGGMLVWAFSGSNTEAPEVVDLEETSVTEEETESTAQIETNEETTNDEGAPALVVGDGSVVASDQPAGSTVSLERATFPIEEGWIGIRDYNNGQLSFIKGVVRFSAAAGLIPEEIILQVPTQPGEEYAVVMFSEDGDNIFNPAGDVQIDQIFTTFTAQ